MSFNGLLIISAIAVAAPILAASVRRVKLPSVVVEIVAGVIVGSSVLGWVRIDQPVNVVALLGLAFLLFLSGLEIDLPATAPSQFRAPLAGFAASLLLGSVAGAAFHAVGWVRNPFFLAITLSATSLGLVVPVLTLLIGVVALAAKVGLQIILGAFLAGVVLNLVDRDTASHPVFRSKLDALGYGFLIPVFFVSSGAEFDLGALTRSPSAVARIPLFLLALLIVRGAPAALYARTVGRRGAVAAGLLQATSLPVIVTAASIGVAIHAIAPVTASALVAAGLMSVLAFPLYRPRCDPRRPNPDTITHRRRMTMPVYAVTGASGHLVLRSLNPVGKDAASVAWERWWPSPHPRAGAGVELAGRDLGGQGDLLRGGEALPG